MIGQPLSIRSWGRDLSDGWNRFWFSPADPATLSVIRILAGAMLFYTHLIWAANSDAFFGPDAWVSVDVARDMYRGVYERTFRWSPLYEIQSTAGLWVFHGAALTVFALLTFGLFSRVVAVLAWLFTLSYIHRLPGAVFGLDQINLLLSMYLMIGPCGARYSVDRWWAVRHGAAEAPASASANVAIRLIQLHLCVIYFFAGIGKLQGPGWWDGSAMWMAMANLEYQSIDMTWMADWPSLFAVMTHITVMWELTYWALIWPRLTRPIVLLLAVPLHLGIALFLGMITFGSAMLFANVAFVPSSVMRRVMDRLAAPFGSLVGRGAGALQSNRATPSQRQVRGGGSAQQATNTEHAGRLVGENG